MCDFNVNPFGADRGIGLIIDKVGDGGIGLIRWDGVAQSFFRHVTPQWFLSLANTPKHLHFLVSHPTTKARKGTSLDDQTDPTQNNATHVIARTVWPSTARENG